MYRVATVIVLLGPPGSGKGTQAALLASALGIPAISTGEMLRRECQSGSALGRTVQAIMASGQLVSDDLINRVVANRIRCTDCEMGFILDGYPRTVAQARYLESLLKTLHFPEPVVLDFDVAPEEIIDRLCRRRQCERCGRIYSIDHAGLASLTCEHDGSPLVQRNDDHPAVIRDRLRVYTTNVGPLVEYYRSRNYHRIEASRAPHEISDDLLSRIAPYVPVSTPGTATQAVA